MNLHQLSVTYHPEEDRLLVRISNQESEEFRLWLTRRLTLALMPGLKQTAADQLARQTNSSDLAAPPDIQRQRIVENFRKEALTYASDFKTPPETKDSVLPMGKQPLLVTALKMTLLKSGQLQLVFIEKLPESERNVQIAIGPQLTQGLLQLLNKCLKKSQWLQSAPLNGAQEATDASETPDPAQRPRYLN